MNLIPAARVFSECAVWFTLLLITPFRWPAELLAGTALACGLGCSVAGALREKPAQRSLCAVIPLLALLIPADSIQRGCMAVPVLYSLLLIFTGHLYADAWRYARHLKLSLLFELLFLIIGCTLRTDRALWILLCGNVYFIFGVYYQHQLRLGSGVSWRGKLRDLASISILPLVSGGVCALIFGGIKPIGAGVIAFATAFARVIQPVVGWCTHLFPHFKTDPVTVTTIPTEATEPTLESMRDFSFTEEMAAIDLDQPLFIGLVLVGVLALLGLLAYGLHRFQMRPTAARSERHWVEADSTVADKPTRAQTRAASNRRRVRKTYSSYLRLLQGRGMFRKLTDTSKDILEAAEPYANSEKGDDLRSIYIRARYQTDLPVPDADVQAAGELLREIKKNLKQ